MSKTSISSKLKITLLKGMEAIGTSASNLAANAKLKVNEINLETRRREILTNFSLQAFELWQKGVQMPDPLSDMLKELSELEERLSVLHAQKYAKVANGETAADGAQPTADTTADGAVADSADATGAEAETISAEGSNAQPDESMPTPRMSCSDGSDGGPIVCSLNHGSADAETPVAPIIDLDVETQPDVESEPQERNE